MYYNQNYNAYPQGYPNSIYGNSFNSPMQPQIRSEIVKVNGENGARAYQLATCFASLSLFFLSASEIARKKADKVHNQTVHDFEK